MNKADYVKKDAVPKLCFIASHPLSVLVFLTPHLKVLSHIFEIRVLANTREKNLLKNIGLNISVESAEVVRNIDLFKDVKAIWRLYLLLKLDRPYAVHTLTPKAGLIGMFAAWLVRVPLRVHTFTGQVWVTHTGLMRQLLKVADKCIAALATDIFVDSPSQRDFLIAEGVIHPSKSKVLASGSMCGVDTTRFFPSLQMRHRVRLELGATEDALVCLYLGRLNRDKGVLDLASAFSKIAASHPKAELWVVGPDERDFFDRMMSSLKGVENKVKRVGYTKVPEQYMQAADLFCLPSYREGFGLSVIEAAACGVPALASRIYGLTDAVLEGCTGWMHAAGSIEDLARTLDSALSSPHELKRRGAAAQLNVNQMFSEERVTSAMVEFYKNRCLDI
jgi:glycosyltransferase involved in cell wall biosynthesis